MLAVLKAIGADGLGVPFTGAGPMAQALLCGTVMAITETPAVAAASNLPILAALSETRLTALPECADDEGAPSPGQRVHGWRRDRARQYAARGGGHAGEGLRGRDRAAGIQDHRRRLNVEARYLPGAAFRKLFEVDFAGQCRCGQADGAGGREIAFASARRHRCAPFKY